MLEFNFTVSPLVGQSFMALQLPLPRVSGNPARTCAVIFDSRLTQLRLARLWLLLTEVKGTLTRQTQSQIAHDLLQRFINDYFVSTGIALTLQRFERVHRKWLWLATPNAAIRFNISITHSEGQIIVAITDGSPFGIDFEQKAVSWAVAKRYFSVQEQAYIKTVPANEQAQIMTDLWQLKEARIKCYQSTLLAGLKECMLSAYLSRISLSSP